MTNPDCGIAILYFSLSPKVQAQRKLWKGVSAALARKTQSILFHHTERIIQKSELPCIHSDENNQRGNDFGSKLSNAIEDVFSLGYHSVIVLGNDCPQLDSSILESAIQQLNGKKVVLGPSQSGVYLMGFHKDQFDKNAFQSLPWQTSNLKASLLDYFKKYSEEPGLLPFLADLNRYHELSFFTDLREISGKISLIFQALLQCLCHQSFSYTQRTPLFISSSANTHRGPPADR